ncbi:MAG: response regulator [Mariprofundaceae bacterium]
MERSRLLLAEDDEALASLLEEYLQEANYDVVVHRRGDTALQALKQEDFDLVLSDIVMPGADGLSLLRHVREQHEHQRSGKQRNGDTLMILMTGYSGIEDALHAVEKGAYDFVSKPFQLPEIRVRLDNAARYQQLLRRLEDMTAAPAADYDIKPASGTAVARAYGRSGGKPAPGHH